MVDDACRGGPLGTGDVVARFLYAWDGVPPALNSMSIHISEDGAAWDENGNRYPDCPPYFFGYSEPDTAAPGTWPIWPTKFDAVVVNNDLAVPFAEGGGDAAGTPEPATVVLLAAGLAALLARRRRRTTDSHS